MPCFSNREQRVAGHKRVYSGQLHWRPDGVLLAVGVKTQINDQTGPR